MSKFALKHRANRAYEGRMLVHLIDEFRRERHPDYLLQHKNYPLGHLTVGEWSAAFEEERISHWRQFIAREDRETPVFMLVHFVRALDSFRARAANAPEGSPSPVALIAEDLADGKLTVDAIVATSIAYQARDAKKRWPTIWSDLIIDPPLADGKRTWSMISQSITHKRNGLTDENCGDANGPYKSLPDLLIRKDLKKPKIKTLTVELIKEALSETHKKTGAWPAHYDGQVMHGELSKYAITWDAITVALRLKTKSQGLENCPYNSIPELIVGEGLMKEKAEMSVRAIRMSAFSTWLASITDKNPQGRWPTHEDGLITRGPLADGRTTWSAVSTALSHKLRGLTEECSYNSLHEFLIGEGLILSNLKFTVEAIAESAMQSWEKTVTLENKWGKWPTQSSGLVTEGPLADGKTTWNQIYDAISKKNRGLTTENCSYESLHDLLAAEAFMPPIIDLTVKLIVESAIAMYNNSNPHRWPVSKDRLIEHGPLANGVMTWNMVDQSIRKNFYGLTDKNCPYKSLADLLVKRGLKQPYRPGSGGAAPPAPFTSELQLTF